MGFRQSTLRVVAAIVFGVLLVGTTAVSAQAKPAPPGPGNSPSAQSCYKGGWQDLATSTGATFASQDACVAYAARGGVLAPKATATLTVTSALDSSGGYVDTVTGSGLLPGATLFATQYWTGGFINPTYLSNAVTSEGTLLQRFSALCGNFAQIVYSTTTAGGATISATAPATC
jgi:hypothetical protein